MIQHVGIRHHSGSPYAVHDNAEVATTYTHTSPFEIVQGGGVGEGRENITNGAIIIRNGLVSLVNLLNTHM